VRFVRWVLIAVGVIAVAAAVRAAEGLRVTPISRDGKVIVSFELTDAYTQTIRDAITSGLKTTFTYDLELRTIVPAWVDRTIATVEVTTADQFDNLTRRHTLTRLVDGRVEEVLVTEDEAIVKAWLTTGSKLPLCQTSKLDPARDYYVRVTVRTRPHGSLLDLAGSITASSKFTFVP
jgi:uncharacterized protein DUF4390